MRFFRLLPTLVLTAVAAGCSWLPEQADETADWSASQIYEEAKAALQEADYETALRYFSKLEARYPYGPYAEQAQLETAYAHYKAGEREAAIAAAERFIKLHPRHENVDYAYYLRGLASFSPDEDLIARLLPSRDEARHDPAGARQAFQYFRELVERFPESRYSQDAIQRMGYLRNTLAQHEMLVADYYLKRGAYVAAANRAKYVVENYPRTPSVREALKVMVLAYEAMEMNDLAADAKRVLQANFGDAER